MKWALALLCVILLAPLALVDVPPLLDYPNHLARAVVLAQGASDPALSRMYAAHWGIIPNLGTDLVLPPLLRVLPVHLAGRMVVGIAILLPVFGTIAYSRAVFGKRSLWPFASALVAYNGTLLLGFLNFVAGVGLALLLAAAWIVWRERFPLRTIALVTIATIALFFCHLMSLVLFAILIGGHELVVLWRLRSGTAATLIRIATTALVFVPSVALYLLSPLVPLADATTWPTLSDKGWQILLPFANYTLPLDIATAGLVVVYLLAGQCRITAASGIPLVVTALLYLVAPGALKSTANFDARFAIMLGFLLFAAALPTRAPRVAVGAFTLLFAVRMTVLGLAWTEHRHDLADLRASISDVEPGARVFVAKVSSGDDRIGRRLSTGTPLDEHLPALLLIEHRAYWPFLFDNASQQPVETLSPYRELAQRAGAIADHRALAEPGTIDLCGYTYLLLLDSSGEPDLAHFAPDRLVLVRSAGYAALFRVMPCTLKSAIAPSGARA